MSTIITNHHWREVLYWEDLTEKERKESRLTSEDLGCSFVRYGGELYCIDEMHLVMGAWASEWDVYSITHKIKDIFMLLVKYNPNDHEYVKIGVVKT